MPSPFQGIDTMSTALRAFQRQLDVTGHNIANINTPGYSRQTVSLSAAEPTTFTEGGLITLGNGVRVDSVNRVRDMFLEGRQQTANSDIGQASAQNTALQQVESIVQEPSTNGISSALGKFFDAWSGLASNAGQVGQTTQVQLAGQTLADRIRGTYASLKDLNTQQQGLATQTLKDIQTSVNNIADLNQAIRQKQSEGGQPNDLMDKRDQAIQELSGLAGIQTQKFSDGSIGVSMNQLTLVDSSGAKTIPTNFNATTNTISNASGSYSVGGGKLKGIFDSINSISSYQTRLDTLANNLRAQVNSLHATGINAAGATGLKFFNDVISGPQTGAIDFNLDTVGVVGPPASVGVGVNAQAIASGVSGSAGDGGLASSISTLQNQSQVSLGNLSETDYYSSLVGDIGRDKKFAATTLDTKSALADQITNQVQSNSGVSLDDEMANMLRFQRSYQAAAKALSTFDSVMGELIDMLKR